MGEEIDYQALKEKIKKSIQAMIREQNAAWELTYNPYTDHPENRE